MSAAEQAAARLATPRPGSALQASTSELSAAIGAEAHALCASLYPICRSLTGEGVRETLRQLREVIPLRINEVPSGTVAFDWTVPDEWNIRDAYVLDGNGNRVIDFKASNLHVIGNSAPIDAVVSRAELLRHLHTNPTRPDWIPYRHTYYRDSWGFCAPHRLLENLNEPEYRVRIDSSIEPGSLSYGELLLPGRERGEILISTHTCHPSLGNDNLSGIAVAALLAKGLAGCNLRFGVRFLFLPATLGPLVWLSRNEELAATIRAGLVLAVCGDAGEPTYVRSRQGRALIDRAIEHVFVHSSPKASIRDFAPTGYDQRQYCSPGFDLPMGGFMRTPNAEYAQYHTSADNLEFITPGGLGDSWRLIRLAIDILQEDRRYLNLSPKGEPRLGPRGLFADAERLGLLWILNLSDGRHTLLDIAERSRVPFWTLHEGVQRLTESGLLREVSESVPG